MGKVHPAPGLLNGGAQAVADKTNDQHKDERTQGDYPEYGRAMPEADEEVTPELQRSAMGVWTEHRIAGSPDEPWQQEDARG